jgi:hypothetical protein
LALDLVKTPRDLAAYRDAAWLLKRHAVSVQPSVASLKALRVFARKEQGAKPLIGFGDPIFNSEEESRPAAQERRVVATRSYTEFWQGQGADRTVLSRALQRLPETATELQAVAQNLGASSSSIHLRQAASETTVTRAMRTPPTGRHSLWWEKGPRGKRVRRTRPQRVRRLYFRFGSCVTSAVCTTVRIGVRLKEGGQETTAARKAVM